MGDRAAAAVLSNNPHGLTALAGCSDKKNETAAKSRKSQGRSTSDEFIEDGWGEGSADVAMTSIVGNIP
jgi:hypothetical protein